jgi:hypothetical protein
LNWLGRSDGAEIVRRLSGNAALLWPDLVAEIVDRTDGVPLFVEEMTKAVLEAGSGRGLDVAAAAPAERMGVPATLHASLMEPCEAEARTGTRAAASSEALRAAASKCSEATRTLTSTCDQTNVSASANSPIITQKAHAGGCLVTGRPAVNYRSACLARRS